MDDRVGVAVRAPIFKLLGRADDPVPASRVRSPMSVDPRAAGRQCAQREVQADTAACSRLRLGYALPGAAFHAETTAIDAVIAIESTTNASQPLEDLAPAACLAGIATTVPAAEMLILGANGSAQWIADPDHAHRTLGVAVIRHLAGCRHRHRVRRAELYRPVAAAVPERRSRQGPFRNAQTRSEVTRIRGSLAPEVGLGAAAERGARIPRGSARS